MEAIDKLIELDRKTRKRIAVLGDALHDCWIHGSLHGCQDHCPKFVETKRLTTAGGAAGAARQLENWNCEVQLFAQEKRNRPVKTRFLDENNRIVFRHDLESSEHFPWDFSRSYARTEFMKSEWDGVLISDYDKGFLDAETIRKIIEHCNKRQIPVVADAKREPEVYSGAILKCNQPYAEKYLDKKFPVQSVITYGPCFPFVRGASKSILARDKPVKQTKCINHVGAGDCFAAHLTLALSHGFALEDAAEIAHAAGSVYVRHLHGRPPFNFEIRKELDPVGGKVLSGAGALRQSSAGRIVFANGVFRIPHAGHAWLLNWAKQQGDILVVGLNDDASAEALRPGEFCLPLKERCEILAGLECVDWIIPYGNSTPCDTIRELKPDLLCKGNEYANDTVPGSDLCEVRFAPESPYGSHCADLVKAVRG